jgi:LPLT family lysophospholipid transporter-like MFS transporter
VKTPSRNYPLLLAGQFLGAFGDNFVLAALLGPLTFQLLAGRIDERAVNAQNLLFSAVFFVPFIVLAPLAGFLNDRFAKTSWLVGGNALKLLGALVGFTGVALAAHAPAASLWQLAGYASVGVGACVYSPAKYGILPEIVPADRLVKANGVVEMLTLIAILGGLWGGAALYDATRSLPVCYGVTAALYAAALGFNLAMRKTSVAGVEPGRIALPSSDRRFRDSLADFGRRLSSLARHPRLGRVLLGCGLFWFAGAVLRGDLQAWGLGVLKTAGVASITNERLALLKIGLILGVVSGSLLAGRLHPVSDLSGTRKYGFALAVGVAALGAFGGHAGIAAAVVLLIAAGLAAGLLLIPLNAALQHESEPTSLGTAIAVRTSPTTSRC